jgi:hypothetical protein
MLLQALVVPPGEEGALDRTSAKTVAKWLALCARGEASAGDDGAAAHLAADEEEEEQAGGDRPLDSAPLSEAAAQALAEASAEQEQELATLLSLCSSLPRRGPAAQADVGKPAKTGKGATRKLTKTSASVRAARLRARGRGAIGTAALARSRASCRGFSPRTLPALTC